MQECPICSTPARDEGLSLGDYRILACPKCSVRFAPDAFASPLDYDDVYATPEYESSQLSSLANMGGETIIRTFGTYQPFFEVVTPGNDRTLLDLGCGVGRFCHAASARGWKVMGADISKRAIEAAKPHASFTLQNSSVDELLLSGYSFEVVTAFEVLEHLTDPVTFLAKVQGLLHASGQFFCTVPNWDCKVVRHPLRTDWVPPIHLFFFTRMALETLLLRSGFRDVTTGFIGTSSLSAIREWRKNPKAYIKDMARGREGLWTHGRL